MSEPVRETLDRLLARSSAEAAGLDEDLTALFEASRASNADDEHDPEGATIAFERAQLSATLDATRRRISELRTAIERYEQGTYGTCTDCGQPIPPDRLEARPAAHTCVTCASRRH